MLINATNTNATLAGEEYVVPPILEFMKISGAYHLVCDSITPNTDGIDTYRVDDIKFFNWDVRPTIFVNSLILLSKLHCRLLAATIVWRSKA
jgi:hypothetical protein